MKKSIMFSLLTMIVIYVSAYYPLKAKAEDGGAIVEIFMDLLSGSAVDFTLEKKSVSTLSYWDENFDLVGATAFVGGTVTVSPPNTGKGWGFVGSVNPDIDTVGYGIYKLTNETSGQYIFLDFTTDDYYSGCCTPFDISIMYDPEEGANGSETHATGNTNPDGNRPPR